MKALRKPKEAKVRKPKKGKCPFKPGFRVEKLKNVIRFKDMTHKVVDSRGSEYKPGITYGTYAGCRWVCAALNAYAKRGKK